MKSSDVISVIFVLFQNKIPLLIISKTSDITAGITVFIIYFIIFIWHFVFYALHHIFDSYG